MKRTLEHQANKNHGSPGIYSQSATITSSLSMFSITSLCMRMPMCCC